MKKITKESKDSKIVNSHFQFETSEFDKIKAGAIGF
jgi:hypothetical protein